jgi:hydrophobic/amphiphilic exporter-1 (mainly G- bacteria), HAE1 family
MLLSNTSIKRPVFSLMMNIVLVVFGLFSLPRLAVDLYPNVDFPVVTVTVPYPGADPQSIEQRVLDPIEDALNGISGLKSLTSSAFPNIGQLVLQFDLDKDSDQASQEVRDKVFAAVGGLPTEASTPIVQKFDVGGAPILNIALKADIDIAELSTISKNKVQPALERIDGIARVNVAGARLPQVQVQIDRDRLSAYGLTAADLANSIRQQNIDLPSGQIESTSTSESIRVKGRLTTVDQIAKLPIVNNKNLNLRISDVANVVSTIEDEESSAFVGNSPTILIAIQKQSEANTTAVASGAKKVIEDLNGSLPKSVSLEIVTDNSVFIEGSIDAVKLDLVLGALLAIVIVLFFLRDFRITMISATALPTAVIATFAFMSYMGFTLNMMTTLALSLSIGILIDDAIIVIENIHRHLEMGKSAFNAALDATKEIGLAVIATTMTLCAVFVPVAFMDGIIGRFFYQFGMTVAFAVAVSLFVAFTLTPMLSSKFLKHEKKESNSKFSLLKSISAWIEGSLIWVEAKYKSLLSWCLDHRAMTLGSGVGIFILSIVMLTFVPVSFFPTEDRSELSISYILPEGSNLSYTKAQTLQLSAALKKYPGVREVVSAVAASGDKKTNSSRLDVKLVPKDQRTYSQNDLTARLRKDLKVFEKGGSEIYVSGGGGGKGGEPIQFILTSKNWGDLTDFANKTKEHVKKKVEGAVDVNISKPEDKQEYQIVVDTVKAADLGVTPSQIAVAVRGLFEGETVGDIDLDGETVDVRLRVADEGRAGVGDITGVSITNIRGEYIPLTAVASINPANAPSTISRFNGQRQITLGSNFEGKDLNRAVTQIQTFIDQNKPENVSVQISGQAEMMKDSIFAMLQSLMLAVLLVFIILCAQYESFSAPMVIMAALPLSLTGAFGALLVTGQVMSIYTMIGIILLMGLVTKNGILLIDFTLQKMNEGLSVSSALLQAGPIRLRPILMTTFAAGGGMLPVAIGHGVGGEARSPMGVAVIGGLLVSTLLTLVVVPCFFSVVESFKGWVGKKLGKNKNELVEAVSSPIDLPVLKGGKL